MKTGAPLFTFFSLLVPCRAVQYQQKVTMNEASRLYSVCYHVHIEYSEVGLIKILEFLIDNIHMEFSGQIFLPCCKSDLNSVSY